MKVTKKTITKVELTASINLTTGYPTEDGLYAIWGITGSGPAIMEVVGDKFRQITTKNYSSGRIVVHKDTLDKMNDDSTLKRWCEEWYWTRLTNLKGL